MKKKIIIPILIIVIIGLCLAIFLIKKQPDEQVVAPTTTIAPINPKTLPVSLSNTVAAYNNVPTLTFPTTLPVYTATQNKTMQGEFTRISTFFNITQAPQEIGGAKGRYLISSNEKESLVVSENPLTMGYIQEATSAARITYDSFAAGQNVLKTIESVFVLRAPITAKISGYESFTSSDTHPEATQDPLSATSLQVSFGLFVDDFPLFTGDAKLPGISARLNSDQVLTELHGFLLPEVQKQPQAMSILSYTEAVTRLQTNSGILSQITNLNSEGFLTGETPKTIDINSVQLGYLLTTGRDTLIPVFVFNGTGFLEKERRSVGTTTIISAIP